MECAGGDVGNVEDATCRTRPTALGVLYRNALFESGLATVLVVRAVGKSGRAECVREGSNGTDG